MNREELHRLFEAYCDDVFRLAYSYLCSRPDAEDVCQTVFLRLAEGRMRLQPGKEKKWLLTCTANACRDLLRSFWRRNVGELDENTPAAEEDWTLYQAVMILPPKYRAVIHLYYYEGFDQGEIADILRISRTAVQTRMSRARTMLKKELSDDAREISEHDGA